MCKDWLDREYAMFIILEADTPKRLEAAKTLEEAGAKIERANRMSKDGRLARTLGAL